MGTDIHLQAEAFHDGKWIEINSEVFKNNNILNKEMSSEEQQKAILDFWDNNPVNRSYLLFAFLADVRNGRGFAGLKTFNPIKPISAPRGLPFDPNGSTCEWDDEDDYLHSMTHFTLDELLSHSGWAMNIKNNGCVPSEDWKAYLSSQESEKPLPCPDTYSAGVSGNNVKIVDESDFDKVVLSDDTEVYVRASWTEKEPLKHTSFWSWLNSEKVDKVIQKYGSSNVRLNIAFDN